MPYWGSGPDDNDFAFDSVGAMILTLKQRLMKGISVVRENENWYPEQSMIAFLTCLRLLEVRFPKQVMMHFGTKDFEFVKGAFAEWYENVKSKIPAKHREGILAEAEKEFALFEETILKKKKE